MFGVDHLGALAASVVIGWWLVARGRKEGPDSRGTRRIRIAMAWVQIVNQVVWHGRKVWESDWSATDSLPLHLCDGAVVVTVIALLRPRPLLVEIAYLWCLAGALQACITPDVTVGFPTYFYFAFFVTHSGLVIAALFLVTACGERPRPGAWWRGMIATNLWALLAAAANVAFGANYMFLREPPPTGSLLDQFGPWPWYIVVAEGLALVSFLLLTLPFRRTPRRSELVG